MDESPLATGSRSGGTDPAYRLARVLVADVYAHTRQRGATADPRGSTVRRAAVLTATGLLAGGAGDSDSADRRRQGLVSGLRAIGDWIESERQSGSLDASEAERLAALHRELERAITGAPPPS